MYDTTIMLKPREQWRTGMTYEKLTQEMDAKLQFPGLTNTWTMPVRNRLDMELTGEFTFDSPHHYSATVQTKAQMAGMTMVDARNTLEGQWVSECPK